MANIADRSLSQAWLAGAKLFGDRGVTSIDPLVVTVTGFHAGQPLEDPRVRELLDEELADQHRRKRHRGVAPTCESVAGTIFPQSLWNPAADRQTLYQRYARILPRLKRHPQNRRGLYFERLVSYGSEPASGNQLEHMITTFEKGVTRASAFQAAICKPAADFTQMPLQGFPCLQQIALHPSESTSSLAITGFYATQYLFSRGYGNYLGLCRLGHFLAHEMKLSLTRMTCVAAHAPLEEGMSKGSVRAFLAKVDLLLRA